MWIIVYERQCCKKDTSILQIILNIYNLLNFYYLVFHSIRVFFKVLLIDHYFLFFVYSLLFTFHRAGRIQYTLINSTKKSFSSFLLPMIQRSWGVAKPSHGTILCRLCNIFSVFWKSHNILHKLLILLPHDQIYCASRNTAQSYWESTCM